MKQSTYYNDIFLATSTDNADITVVSDAIDGVAGKIHTHETATNPHNITKSTISLGNVDNVKQAPNTHLSDATAHNGVLAPVNHASTAQTYGKGTSTNYGHLKLSDAIDSTSTVNGGIAATPKAVKLAYDEAVSCPFVKVFTSTKTFTTKTVSFTDEINENKANCCAYIFILSDSDYSGNIHNGSLSSTAAEQVKVNTKMMVSGREFVYMSSTEGSKFYLDNAASATDLSITLIGIGVRL